MKNIQRVLLLTICIWSTGLNAQGLFALQANEGTIKITGTSSVHDWEMDVFEPTGSATFIAEQSKAVGIESLSLILPSTKIESGNNIMDRKTRKALNSEVHPTISFKMTSADPFTYKEGSFTGLVTGNLSINGQSKIIKVSFTGTHNGEQIVVKGSHSLLLTEYDIEPPTAMMGTMKTGDQIEIIFATVWKLGGRNSAAF